MTHKAKPCVLFVGHENNDPDQNSAAYEQGLVYQNLNKNEKYHPTTTKTEISCQVSTVYDQLHESAKTSMCTQH